MLRIYCKFQNAIKKQQNVFAFSDKCIWKGSGNPYLLGYNYTWLEVSALKSSQISNLTKNLTFKKLFFCRSEQFSGLVNTFIPEGFSETRYFMHLATSFGANNFRNT